jgi:CheY-like chemotaxis protein
MSARVLVVDDSATIRKVVKSILEARAYEAVTAEDGQDALEKLASGKVDLVLLDFVMPRMNGYQFCRVLRAKPELKGLPVVLMSAKGDKIRGQFVQQTGAVDAITKPFDARGLVAVIEGALKKHVEGRARPVPDASAMPEEDAIVESLRPSLVRFSDDPRLRRVQEAGELAAALSKIITPELLKIQEPPARAEEQIGEAFGRAITPDVLRALAGLIKSLDFDEDNQGALNGDLKFISIAEILQLLNLQRQNGGLGIFARNQEITLFIRDGNIDFAASHGLRDEFLLGRYLVEDGAVTRADLDTVLAKRASDKRIGESLVELALCTEKHVHAALVRQTSELVYEVVRWNKGRFTFTVSASSHAAKKARLGLSTSAVIMEGFRRVDEWRLIEGSFDFDEVLFRDHVAIERLGDASKLTRQERAVLDAINGERTVREIVDEMGGSSFELCKILYQFLNSRLVRRKAA